MSHYIKYAKWTFPADRIKSGNLYLTTSLLGSSLEVNSFSAEVECGDTSIMSFKRNEQLLYYTKPDQPMIFRVQDIERTAPKLYKISATSTLGLLCEGQHYGGIYTGEEAQTVIASICGTVPFIVKGSLQKVKLYGWLPVGEPRSNLAQVLFAIGATLKTDLDGVLRIEGLWDGISRDVGSDRMYIESSMKYTSAVTEVSVTEHQYIKGAEEKQLFEGTTMKGDVITFSEPMHSLTASGFTILAQGANFARLSAGTGVLRGIAYIHSTREVVRSVSTAAEPNIKAVKDATLVSLVNSAAAANRLANYYKWRETVDAPVIYRGELPGDRIEGFHPFDRVGTYYCLQSADISLSNTLKAQAKGLVGFVPEQIEEIETYDYREVLTGSGTWTAPEGAASIVAVLIGGGSGGRNGSAAAPLTYISVGSNTTTGSVTLDVQSAPVSPLGGPVTVNGTASNSFSSSGCAAVKGGAGGAGGAPGNVYRVEISVSPGQKIQYSCGAGGRSGSAGSDTTFGAETSASGGVIPSGYVDVTTGETFAVSGRAGSNGGDGGAAGSAGASVGGVSGGAGIASKSENNMGYGGWSVYSGYNDAGTFWFSGTATMNGTWNFAGSGGGGAGGSSVENRGSAGTAGSAVRLSSEANYINPAKLTATISGRGLGGAGANGAPGVVYGSGGDGGGGAGGNGAIGNLSLTASLSVAGKKNHDYGGSSNQNPTYRVQALISNQTTSSGASGGIGGAGAPGCIILYYGTKKEKQSGQFVDKYGRTFLGKFERRLIV